MLQKMEIEATGESGGFKLRGILNFMAYEIIILNKLGCFSSLVCSKVDLYQGINKNIYIYFIYIHTHTHLFHNVPHILLQKIQHMWGNLVFLQAI